MSLVRDFLMMIDHHGYTQSYVGGIIGFKSQTSMTRILQGKVSQKILIDFAERLEAHAAQLCLTTEELARLRLDKEELIMGSTTRLARQYLYDLITGETGSKEEDRAAYVIQPMDSPAKALLPAQLFEGADSVSVTMVGVCSMPLLNAIADFESKGSLQVAVYHNESQDPHPVCKLLWRLQTLIHKPWLTVFTIRNARNKSRSIGESVLWMDISYPDHKKSLMLIDKETNAFLVNLPADHLPFSEMFLYEGEQPEPMGVDDEDMSNYMHYLNYLRSQEKNHRVYRIKPDLGLEMIPGDIQLAALREGSLGDNEELAGLGELLAGIETERYNNYKTKKKHQYNVFSYQAMRRFAETGRQSDHFWAFRSFTPEETLWIMRDLLTNARQNRYFHFRFLQPDGPMGQ